MAVDPLVMRRIKAVWNIPNAGNCSSTFYWQDVAGGPASVREFLFNLRQTFAPPVTVQVQGTVERFHPADGHLVDVAVETTPALVASTATGNYSAPSGYSIQWNAEGTFPSYKPGRGPHPARGRLYIVPMSNTYEQDDGTLQPVLFTIVNPSITAFLSSPGPFVWHRPSKGGTDGHAASILSGTVKDRVHILRSRRQ